jgi:uncharacterized protein (DUF427 family)
MTESVWDYPRPPALEPCTRRVRIELGGITIVDSTNALRILETSHPPSIYVPPQDVLADALQPAAGGWITADLRGPFKGAPGTLGW